MQQLKIKDFASAMAKLKSDRVAVMAASKQVNVSEASDTITVVEVQPPPAPIKKQQSPVKVKQPQQPSRRKNVLRRLDWLRRKYPRTFFTGGEQKPLKIEIYHDLVAAHSPDVSKSSLRAALACYTNNLAYIKSLLVEGAVRVDLQGEVCVGVSALEAAEAARRLQARANKVKVTAAL